jgi:hypothetical protein
MLDPKINEFLQVNQSQFSRLLSARFGLSIARKTPGRDEDSNILFSEKSHEGAQAVNVDFVCAPFDLNLDTRRACS